MSYRLLENGSKRLLEGSAGARLLEGVNPSTPVLLRQAIAARLLASSGITSLVGSAIYFGALPQTWNLANGPALTFLVIGRSGGHVLSGADGTSSARVQFSAWAYSESLADQIIKAVFDRFDGFQGTIGSVQILASLWQNEVDLPASPRAGTDQWIYQIASDYLINHRLSYPASLGA